MDVSQIRELIKLVETSEVNEVMVEEGEVKITIRKGMQRPEIEVMTAASVETAETGKKPTAEGESELPDHWREIRSPMVGTFYRAPSPGAEPFVDVGTEIEPGQTLCILEAMKLMNEITSEDRGVIRKIMVENSHPVEFGQPLFFYEPVD